MRNLIANKVLGAAKRLGLIPYDDVRPFYSALSAVPESERNQSDLHRLFYAHDGASMVKWKHYLSIYDRHLSRFRNQPVRILEIGVLGGGSLDLWRKYFGPEAVIFGVDISPECALFDGRSGSVRIGSQADPDFLRRVVAEMGGVDVVIDDGSHVAKHQKITFETLFPILDSNGVYICEDLHTSYWPGPFQGGYRRKGTFIELAKAIVDDIHSDFHLKSQKVAEASRSVDGVHFYNSMVVIEKSPQQRPQHLNVGNR